MSGPVRRAGRASADSGRAERVIVRSLVVVALGVMGTGFLGWRAGLLVAALTALTYGLVALLGGPGRGRALRGLGRAGYRVLPDGTGRHMVVGPGGVFLIDGRSWRHAVARAGGTWRLGEAPAARVVGRAATAGRRLAGRLTEELAPGFPHPVDVVAILAVAGRLPEPAMRAGDVVLARPGAVAGYLAERPEVLDAEAIESILTAARRAGITPV